MSAATHDPVQLLIQLRQTLSADKLAVGFLIGAGCPCAIRTVDEAGQNVPLIPDIRGLTARVSDKLNADESTRPVFEKLKVILSEDNVPDANIETMLNRIRAMRDVAGESSVRGLTHQELDLLDRAACEVIRDVVTTNLPNTSSPYHMFARYIYRRSAPCSEIFTTNYDLLMEEALEDERVPYFDGFVGVYRPFFDQRAIEDDRIPERWARFWKLHGSVNWRIRKNKKGVFRSLSYDEGDELLIHPSHMKYDESRRMPYFVMIDRLRGFLRNRDRPTALFVLGYSFGDQHLNEAIVEGLSSNPSSTCFALRFSPINSYNDGRKLALANYNLSLLAPDAAVIRGVEAKWVASASTNVDSISPAFTPKDIQQGDSPTSDSETDEPQECELQLGDFAAFARFLNEFAAYGAPPGPGAS